MHAVKACLGNLVYAKRVESIEDVAYIPIIPAISQLQNSTLKTACTAMIQSKCTDTLLKSLKSCSISGEEVTDTAGKTCRMFTQVCIRCHGVHCMQWCMTLPEAYNVSPSWDISNIIQ